MRCASCYNPIIDGGPHTRRVCADCYAAEREEMVIMPDNDFDRGHDAAREKYEARIAKLEAFVSRLAERPATEADELSAWIIEARDLQKPEPK